jgi:benzoyl-CoA reductase/2-hydroxyglutaryl-CoA dehydratase subunit BcrC/BadD/HgdB
MKTIPDLLNLLAAPFADLPATLAAQKSKGKKIVGVFPVYAPEELAHAAGAFPVGCWGGKMNISKAAKLLPPFACQVMQGITELSLSGAYDVLDGALISAPCDTLKCFTQNFKITNPKVKAMYCLYPQNNKLEGAVRYLYNELHKVGREMEELTGEEITALKLQNSIRVYNQNRAAMMEFSRLLAQKPGLLTPSQRHTVMKSRFFMDKEEHTVLMQELNQALQAAPAPKAGGRKVLLAGIMSEPQGFVQLLDELGFQVVADELACQSRQFRNPVPPGLDQYQRLARQWQNVEGCSVVYDPEGKRAGRIVDLARESGADGVLYCQMKFCEEEEFDYPFVKSSLDAANIPVLNIEIDSLNFAREQTRTRLQAFIEQLEITL